MKNININAFADEASPLIDGQIKAMLENGVSGLEMRNVDDINVSDISPEKAKEVRQKLDGAGLKTWSIGSPIGKIDIEKDDFGAEKEKLKRTLETADILGAKNIRLFSFYIPEGKNTDDYKDEVISRLGEFLDIAKDSGIDLCHENEKGIYGAKAKECLEIHSALPEMKGIFDPANFVQCGQDTLEAWDMLGKYIKYMHIKDALWDGRVVPAGKGDGNVEKIVAGFISNGGRDFTIEPHLTVFDGLAGLEKDGNTSEVGTLYSYPTNEAAFKAAVDAFKSLI